MTYKDLFELKEGLEQVKQYGGVKFAIIIAKNLTLINKELEILRSAMPEPSKEYTQYLLKIRDLQKKFKETEDKEERDTLNKEYQELTLANKDIVIQVKQDEERFLNEEIEIELQSIPEELLPEEITAGEVLKIYSLIYGHE